MKKGDSPARGSQFSKGTREGETHLVVIEPVSTGYHFELRLWPDFALVCQDLLERGGVFGFLDRRTEEGVNLPQGSEGTVLSRM